MRGWRGAGRSPRPSRRTAAARSRCLRSLEEARECPGADRSPRLRPANFLLWIQAFCTNSNWRERFATRQMKCSPRSSLSSVELSASSGESFLPYSRPRRSRRWKRVGATRSSRNELLLKPSMRSRRANRLLVPGGQIAGARVGAPDMGADRAAEAGRIGRIGEVVRGDVLERRPDAFDRLVTQRHQRRALIGSGRPWPRPGANDRGAPRSPAGRGTARSRGRPDGAAGTPGSCRCARGRAGWAHPPPAAGRAPGDPRSGRSGGARCSGRTRCGSRARSRPERPR